MDAYDWCELVCVRVGPAARWMHAWYNKYISYPPGLFMREFIIVFTALVFRFSNAIKIKVRLKTIYPICMRDVLYLENSLQPTTTTAAAAHEKNDEMKTEWLVCSNMYYICAGRASVRVCAGESQEKERTSKKCVWVFPYLVRVSNHIRCTSYMTLLCIKSRSFVRLVYITWKKSE